MKPEQRYHFSQMWIGRDYIPHERGMDCVCETKCADGMMFLKAITPTKGMSSILVNTANLDKFVCEVSEKSISVSIFYKYGTRNYHDVKEALLLGLRQGLKEYRARIESSVEMFGYAIRRAELGNLGEPPAFKFKVGDIVRTGAGETALFKITDISPNHGGNGARYYGRHILGGYSGAYETDLLRASKKDLQIWEHKYGG